MSALLVPSVPWLNLALRGAVVYVVVVFLLRLGGKKQVGQMGIAEFAALLLISNAVQNSMNGGDCSLTGGLAVAAVVLALSWLFSYLAYKSKRWESLLQGRPRLLIHNGEVLEKNMALEQLNFRELHEMLRLQGIHDVRQIAEGVLESSGALSVVLKSERPPQQPA
jgi:uncharacterized membrane protein YcaP (DUF421 family)